ncbi:MAG: VWA domain-containing protein [Treponema sp.]|nr:VWA domain-containing protein [Treponema sp.]
MTFDHPVILFAFFIFIPLVVFDIINDKKMSGSSKRKQLFKERQLTDGLNKKLRISVFLFRLFLAFAVIALAGPRWGTGFTPSEYYRGLDTVFAIDISRSMDIYDLNISNPYTGLPYSRLEYGLRIARETITSLSASRYAAAIGRGKGYLAVPLTYDSEAALVFLESLDGSSMTGRSTNLESLIEAAYSAFQSSSAAHKAIVLISDGESHTGVLRNVLNLCANEGIIINTVAVGSDEGRQIYSLPDNPESPLVISRRDSALLRNLAERTGGIYIDGNREDASFVLSSHLLSISPEAQSFSVKTETKQRRTFFIILALIAYSTSKFVTRQYQKPPAMYKPRFLHRTQTNQGSLVVLVILSFSHIIFSSCTEGKLLLMEANYLNSRNRYEEALVSYQKALEHKDAAPYAEYGLGLTFYLLDQEDMALNRYGDSQKLLEILPESEHRELRYRNYYNSGVIFFEKEDYNSAAAFFREALREDPRKIDAKRNLELSLLSISMESTEQNNKNHRQEQREILFDYLREQEQQIWKSREWAQEDNYSGPDY